MFIDPVRDYAPGNQSVAGGPGVGPELSDSAEAEHQVDLSEMSYSELRDRVVSLVAERARLEGQYLAALGEMTSRCGPQGAAHGLREYTRMTSTQARHDARLADDLANHGLSATLAALQAGEIQTSHARVIARETPKKHRRSEEEFLELCAAYPADTVARHPLAYESLEVFADLAAEAADGRRLDPVDAELAFQRAERSGSICLGDDGMWHLRAKLDFIAGREVSLAIQAAVRSARHCDGAEESTRSQLTADAISDLIASTLRLTTSSTTSTTAAPISRTLHHCANLATETCTNTTGQSTHLPTGGHASAHPHNTPVGTRAQHPPPPAAHSNAPCGGQPPQRRRMLALVLG